MICDFCKKEAVYDVRLPLYGSWGNVCETHFIDFGCTLGLGNGQKLNNDKDIDEDTEEEE